MESRGVSQILLTNLRLFGTGTTADIIVPKFEMNQQERADLINEIKDQVSAQFQVERADLLTKISDLEVRLAQASINPFDGRAIGDLPKWDGNHKTALKWILSYEKIATIMGLTPLQKARGIIKSLDLKAQ